MSSMRDGGAALPPELLNNDPQGFAWGVWHERTPKLLAQIKDAHPYGRAQRYALDELLEEIAGGLMRPLGLEAHDRQVWGSWGEAYFGRPWSEAPFLWSEAYFYRRVLEAVGYFAPGPWRWTDPFEPFKTAELTGPALAADLAALEQLRLLPEREQGRAKLLASLWGNQADLGYSISHTPASRLEAPARLVIDDSDHLWDALGPQALVIVVADNAGRELLADMVLIDHLLRHGLAGAVDLHVKPVPYYVSDATASDVSAAVRRLATAAGTPAEVGIRLRNALTAGALRLCTHGFYCAPWSYHDMPGDLAGQFRNASLTILKGDLNYRRLTGDRDWPPTTPFCDVTSYFPGQVAALRTLKSDVLTGVPADVIASLSRGGQSWRTDGSHAVIQARTR